MVNDTGTPGRAGAGDVLDAGIQRRFTAGAAAATCGVAVRRTRSAAAVPILQVLELARGAAGERSDRGGAALPSGEELHADLAVVRPRFSRLDSPERRRKGDYGAVVHRRAGARGGRRGRAGAGPGARPVAGARPVPPVPCRCRMPSRSPVR